MHTRLSILLLIAPLLAGPCALALPAQGPMVREFSPDGLYGGHWGIDVAVDPGTSVRAAGAGIVTFSGVVAGNQTVTVHHGGGVRTSYSFLTERYVTAGQRVATGDLVGASGVDHDVAAIHFSLRVADRYVDPLTACRVMSAPSPGLRLSTVIASYPVGSAPRIAGRDVRPASSRPSDRR